MQNSEERLLASSCLSVRPSVCPHLGSHWTDFYEIKYLSIFLKTCNTYCLSTAAMVEPTHLSVTSYVTPLLFNMTHSLGHINIFNSQSIVNTNTCTTSLSLIKIYLKFLKNTSTCFGHSTIIREFFYLVRR